MVDEKTMEETLTFSNDSANYEAFYLGGIVFENPEDYKTEIPKNISYKIRQVNPLEHTWNKDWNH